MMFEGEYAKLWIEDTILFIEYRSHLVLTKQTAMEVLRSRLAFQRNQEYAVFCDPSGIVSADTDALDYLSREGTLLIKAVAFYTPSPLNILLTEFFLETHRRRLPAGIFKHKIQALKFLKSHSQ
ncbi:hypothetical protein GCM10007103_12890 [Salinimicrobium marinum]|uniref:DUF7793 domain-containing protein n=1 Tax=Salinimicrobium marinum TaxID=680283 RepID=A0A918SAJ2_9FLAO|nr:STAS/SEC14 domain-containing protein [Salinimicrobium marinum]GHA32865.1 hypothetical protein GCM10007103_12890 [Salinimicrobium marinum]